MEEIIIWGAGKVATRKCEWAVWAGYQVKFFVDNDAEKWGKTIEGIPICSPEILREYRGTVVIPDLYYEEIRAQLNEMSYQGNKVGFKQFRKEVICKKKINIKLPDMEKKRNNVSFVFDSYFKAFNWGGVESWSCMVANQLLKSGMEARLICGPNKKFDKFTKNILHFCEENELVLIEEMAVKIAGYLPCIFISQGSVALNAAQIVKTLFSDQIQIVMVAHADEPVTYERLQFWEDRLDKIICISRKIKYELQNKYGVQEEILVYHPNPIQLPNMAGKRGYENGILKIGFAARLNRIQKRAHLLPDIMEMCSKKGLNVEFNIAGEGDCLDQLLSYVSDRHLENSVHILGWIPPTKMADFWKEQDVYLNLSDFEGMSLAMLEAMACGAVPVVTDVSGVSDMIQDGKNGFIIPVDSWLEAADKIEVLSGDRGLLKRAGEYNMGLIREKCDVSDYADWLMEMFYF
nr:glycosyltransferase family 4 protein [uncultured Acetatifactor sp.]